MDELEKIKTDILDDYRGWMEIALIGTKDEIGIVNMMVKNFELKINKLIEAITK